MSSVEMPHKYVPPPLELVKGRIEELLPPAAREEIDAGKAVLIDVRDPERFEAGHLPGALDLPSGESARDAHDASYAEALEQVGAGPDRPGDPGLRRGQPLGRTADALQNEHGFENVASMVGGSKLWSDLGYPDRGRDRDRRRGGRDTLGRRGGHNLMASIETIEQVKKRIEELDPAEAQEELARAASP